MIMNRTAFQQQGGGWFRTRGSELLRSGMARLNGATLLAMLAVLTAAAAPEREGAAGAAIAAAVRAGATGISTTAEGSDGQQLTWASWTEGSPDRWVTRLVLIRPSAEEPAVIWGVQRLDGYGAVLRPTLWQWRGHPVLILQYQFGAAYTRMELYAAGPDGQASMLGSLDGALIAVDRRGTRETLRAYDSATLRGPQRCFGWNDGAATLATVPCGPDRPGALRP